MHQEVNFNLNILFLDCDIKKTPCHEAIKVYDKARVTVAKDSQDIYNFL